MNLISFSLFGAHPFYCKGAIQNASLAKVVYPDWQVRCYVRKDVPSDIVLELKKLDVEIINMPLADTRGPLGDDGGFAGTFWRFLPVGDTAFDNVIIRDVDSRLNVREKAAVDEWISSGFDFHLMRDNPQHVYDKTKPNSIIMAGMWGARGGKLAVFEALTTWPYWNHKTSDQEFLSKKLWPTISKSVIQHGSGGLPFPPHSAYNGFVGEYVDENGNRSNYHPLEKHP